MEFQGKQLCQCHIAYFFDGVKSYRDYNLLLWNKMISMKRRHFLDELPFSEKQSSDSQILFPFVKMAANHRVVASHIKI